MLSIRSDNSVPLIYVAYPTITACEGLRTVGAFEILARSRNVLLATYVGRLKCSEKHPDYLTEEIMTHLSGMNEY